MATAIKLNRAGVVESVVLELPLCIGPPRLSRRGRQLEQAVKNMSFETSELRMSAMVKIPKEWLVDYQPARERAIRWLGERYLLARDVPRVTARASARAPVP